MCNEGHVMSEQRTPDPMVLCRKCSGTPIMDAIAGPYNTRTRSQPVIGYQVFCIDCDNNSERGETEEAAEANWEKENAK